MGYALNRLYAVDALRAFCIFIVMGHHFFNPAPGHYSPPDVLLGTLEPLFRNGALGVTGFFTVSGFLITRLLMQGGERPRMRLKEFYVRRFGRLMPLLLLFVALAWLAHGVDPGHATVFYGQTPGAFSPVFWLSIFLFVFNWYLLFTTVDPIGLHWGLLWSLAVEEQFYLFYPVVLRKLDGVRKTLVFLLSVAAASVLFRWWIFMHLSLDAPWGRVTPSTLDSLAVGATTYLLWGKCRDALERKPAPAVALAVAGVFIVLRTIYFSDNRPLMAVTVPAVLAVGCSFFLIGACSLPPGWSWIFKPGAWVGRLSYGLYLLHVSLYFLMVRFLVRIPSLDLGAASYFAAAFGLSWLIHRYYEVPANRWICARFGVVRREIS
jgi:peptidoglycan/LPS O-acetylase OafA/YrhL